MVVYILLALLPSFLLVPIRRLMGAKIGKARDLPSPIIEKSQRIHRSIRINGQEIEFSDGFPDLHTKGYKEILAMSQHHRLALFYIFLTLLLFQIFHSVDIEKFRATHLLSVDVATPPNIKLIEYRGVSQIHPLLLKSIPHTW